MRQLRRTKLIKEGQSNVIIEKIESITNKNGFNFFKISVKRKTDNAKRDFWINEESYLINKLIDLFFKDDSRDTFELDEFIGKEIAIVVKVSDNGFYNITNIKSIAGLTEECQKNEEELIKEENHYTEEDDDLIGNIDLDALDNIDLDALDKVNLDDELDDDFNFGDESDDDFNFDYIIGEA